MPNPRRESLSERNRTDLLTGLNNRNFWLSEMEREFNRCQRSVLPSSLVLFDIDGFRRINLNHGHQTGDQLLRSICRQPAADAAADRYHLPLQW